MYGHQADFKYLKEHVSIGQVLSHYGVELRAVRSGNLRGRCPLPTHSSRVSTASFSVNLPRNVWSCQSASCIAARAGQIGGNVLDLVAAMERCSLREAGIRMASWLGSQISTTPVMPRQILREPLSEENNPPLGFVLHKVDPWHSYLAQRGIQIATAKTFGAGFYNDGGLHAGRIVIPIHDHAGCLVAYAGRSIAGEEPKYRFPAGFQKSLVLFNLHRAVQSGEKTAIVVEGFFDAMKVHQAGHANVVALMGSSLSQRQSDLLANHFNRATIMLDGDAAGRHAADVIERLLAPRMNVTRRNVGVGRQPDQMQTRDINAILSAGPTRARSLER